MTHSAQFSVAFLAVTLFAFCERPATAQSPPVAPPTHEATITTGTQTLLRLLFASAGKRFAMDKNAQGVVYGEPIIYASTTFEQALHGIMEAAHPAITYEIRDGVYYFHAKRIPLPAEVTKRITLLGKGPTRVEIERLFLQAGLNNDLQFAPDVHGTVTVYLTDVTFAVALQTLLDTAKPPLALQIDGRYRISVQLRSTPAK